MRDYLTDWQNSDITADQSHSTSTLSKMSATLPLISGLLESAPPPPHVQYTALSDSTSRKPDSNAPPSQPRPNSRRFSTTPHFDLASSSSTAYIALPVPETMPVPPNPRDKISSFLHRNLGLICMASAQLFFSMMNLCAKLLSLGDPPIHPLEIIFTRMLITWMGALAYLHYNKVPDYFIGPKGVRLLLVLRGVVGFFGLFGIYYSLQYLDLSDATILTFLAPILTGYFGRIFLKEPFLRTELYAGILSLLGVVLIARPQSLFGSESTTAGDATGLQRLAAVGVALLGVLGAAGAYTSIRAIGHRAHPLISVSMFSLYATCVSGIGLLVLREPFVFPQTLAGWGEWTVIGISGFVAQLLVTAGLQRERAGRGASMVYLQMLFAFGFERYLSLGTSINSSIIWGVIPDFWSISGSGLILGGAIWVAIAKSRIKHDHQDDLERNEYAPVNNDEHTGKDNEFELGEISEDEEEQVASSSGSPRRPSPDRRSENITREDEVLTVAVAGELNEVTYWEGDDRE
jgi:drug/metabolite transporter (DMT)-like permease